VCVDGDLVHGMCVCVSLSLDISPLTRMCDQRYLCRKEERSWTVETEGTLSLSTRFIRMSKIRIYVHRPASSTHMFIVTSLYTLKTHTHTHTPYLLRKVNCSDLSLSLSLETRKPNSSTQTYTLKLRTTSSSSSSLYSKVNHHQQKYTK